MLYTETHGRRSRRRTPLDDHSGAHDISDADACARGTRDRGILEAADSFRGAHPEWTRFPHPAPLWQNWRAGIRQGIRPSIQFPGLSVRFFFTESVMAPGFLCISGFQWYVFRFLPALAYGLRMIQYRTVPAFIQ